MATPLGLSKTNLAIWLLINEMAQNRGCWIVSAPNTSPIRLECLDQELPMQLERMGFSITALGTNDRLIPQTVTEQRGCRVYTTTNVVPGTVLLYEVCLETEPKPVKTTTFPSS